MNHDRVLIVGAGLAGLALARALGHAGLAPQVVEREAGWDDAGTGIYLPANGVRGLRTLGLEGAAAARGARIARQRLMDHRGRLLAEIDLHQLWGVVGPCLALTRTELHKILREGMPVQLGRTVRSLERLEGPVHVTFDDGRAATMTWPTGADGLRSTVRRLAVDPRPPVPVGQHSWRFLAACPPEVTTWTVMLGRGASFLTVPVSQGLAYAYADVTAGTAGSGEGNGDPLGRLRERFAGSPTRFPGCWTSSRTRPGSTWRRSSRSPKSSGVAGQWCWSATPPTACRPTWPRAPPWPSRTPWCWPAAYATPPRSPTRWPPSSPDGAGARAGSGPRPTAATAPATSHRPSATSPCGPSDGSSTPTTDPCWIRSRPQREDP
jgi:2-polyprenyl-6-methoxyphenol hydroxylase-like FAD-dependent oxidoreductase